MLLNLYEEGARGTSFVGGRSGKLDLRVRLQYIDNEVGGVGQGVENRWVMLLRIGPLLSENVSETSI